jgi:hypothetical protein
MMSNGIEVVVSGSRRSDGAWLATFIGQVPPGTQPAPPDNEVVGPPPGSGDGTYAVVSFVSLAFIVYQRSVPDASHR